MGYNYYDVNIYQKDNIINLSIADNKEMENQITINNIDSIKKPKTKIVEWNLKWNFLKSSKIDMGKKDSYVKNVTITIYIIMQYFVKQEWKNGCIIFF